MDRQMIAILVHKHRRNELCRDQSFVDGANRRFGNGNFIAETSTSRFHPLANEAEHFENHRNEVENFGDLDTHRLEIPAAVSATTFIRIKRNMNVSSWYVRGKRLATATAVRFTLLFRLIGWLRFVGLRFWSFFFAVLR